MIYSTKTIETSRPICIHLHDTFKGRITSEQLKVTLSEYCPKGLHLYFKTQKDYPQKVAMVTTFGLKCDFRCANKGYVLLPMGTKTR